jgi:hypothetical protein
MAEVENAPIRNIEKGQKAPTEVGASKCRQSAKSVSKPRRVSVAHDGNNIKSVISGDMCIGNNTSHDAAAEQPSCKLLVDKCPLGFVDRLSADRSRRFVII